MKIADRIKRSNTIVYCDQWEQTVTFYGDELGLDIAFQNDWLVEFRLTATSFVSVADQSRTTISGAACEGITLSLQIDDIEALHRDVVRKGLAPTDIRPQVMGADVFYLRDPAGTRIEFWCPSRPGPAP